MSARDQVFLNNLDEAISSLLIYCRSRNWAGYDPYDALNSTLFRRTPFFASKFCRIAFTQAMKRSPINLRAFVGVPREQNPKGLALFLTALLKIPGSTEDAKQVAELLMKAQSPGRPYTCWGYNFDWQNRVTFVPRGEPNIICTTFAGNALLDAYETIGDERYCGSAIDASEFLFKELCRTELGKEICFAYTPRDREQIHNANLLGGAFLARLYKVTGNRKFLSYAVSAAEFSVARQKADGSWPYGEAATQQWIDNFHTGYNLLALRRIAKVTGDPAFEDSVKRGFDFYAKHFFLPDGTAKYYDNSTYPIDIHAIAQSLITLVELRDLGQDNIKLCRSIFKWSCDNMRSVEGYFYFQKRKILTNKTSYMRWSQAWMLLALAMLKQSFRASESNAPQETLGCTVQ